MFTLRLFIYAFTNFIPTGISSHVLPSSVRPARFFCTPPHCLKKNGTLAHIYTLIPNIHEPFLRDWQPGTYKLKETINFLSAINDGGTCLTPAT